MKRMNKRHTREEKIKFLKGLITGENKIHELQPMQHLVLHFDKETQTYKNEKMNLKLTMNEFREYQNRHPGGRYIIVYRTTMDE